MEKDKIELNEKNYVDRDISWMYFNHRIIKEADKKSVPLYDRLMFLGIYSNNLDEFYKVRVAGLKRIAESKSSQVDREERKQAQRDVERIVELTQEYSKEYDEVKHKIFDLLEKKGVYLINDKQLNDSQKKFIHEYYMRNVAGYINPIVLSRKADLSDVNDSHIFLSVKMEGEGTTDYALIALPDAFTGRFIRLPVGEDKKNYVIYVDDIVRYHLPYIFAGLKYTKFSAYAFKFSKDAEMEVESDPEESVLRTISHAVRDRKKGIPVRVIFGEGTPDDLKKVLMKRLDLDKGDLVSVGGRYHNNKDLMKFPRIGNYSYEPWDSVEIPVVDKGESMIDRIHKKDLLVHVPYESFDAFIKLLQEAAINPKVTEIKASIYRAAKNSKVVKALVAAAQNGKKVTAMVELMARFDESSNISISQTLRDAGCDVLTGSEGFKVHGKIVYIKVKDGPDIAVISTGNFHEGNAKTYTDCLLFTCNPHIVKEVNSIFAFIAQPYRKQTFKQLLVSPNHMQSVFQRLIRNEEKNRARGLPAGIKIKINHITDQPMVKLLYEASQAGVPIKLLIRGNSSIVTGIPGLSDNIEVHAIIDRYLEHSRIFIFENGGDPLYFMGSADWMPRNLYNRIEVVTPVYDPDIQKELEFIVDAGLKDNTNASLADGSGNYISLANNKEAPYRSQAEIRKYTLEKDGK